MCGKYGDFLVMHRGIHMRQCSLGGGGSNPASRNVKILMTCKTCKISGERGKLPLKGVCHEIFDLYCFHDSIPFGSLISRLKHFRIIFKFHRDIQIFKKLHGVQLTSESIVPNFSGVMNTKSQKTPRCALLHWDNLPGVLCTAESNCTMLSQNQNLHLYLVVFKGTIRTKPFMGELIYHKR